MINNRDIGIGFTGLCIGALAVCGFALYIPPQINRVETFQRDDKTAIMRVYRPQSSDAIYVADSENKNNYIILKQHLEKMADKADRELEEATIKKVVGWYDE